MVGQVNSCGNDKVINDVDELRELCPLRLRVANSFYILGKILDMLS